MSEKNREDIPLNKNSVVMHFESDLKVWISIPSPWSASFEYWWIKKSLLKLNGNFCMNCRMMRKQEIYLEAVQIVIHVPSYRERLNLQNYQTLCNNCIRNPHIRNIYNARLGQSNTRVPQLPSFFEFADPCFEPISASELLKWRRALEGQLKISVVFDWSELEKEYKWAKIISQDHHRLISKAARKDDFVRRDAKYSVYLSLLKMKPQELKRHTTYTDHTFYEIYDLFNNPVRRYLVEKLGGISKTSKVYAATKVEFKQNSFLGKW